MGASHKRQRRPLFPPAWTVKGLADALGIDRNVIYAAINAGELDAYKIGVRRFVLTETVVEWIKSHRKVSYDRH